MRLCTLTSLFHKWEGLNIIIICTDIWDYKVKYYLANPGCHYVIDEGKFPTEKLRINTIS